MQKVITQVIGQYMNALSYISPRAAGQQGFKLFCYPIRTPIKTHQKEFLDTADKFSFQHKNNVIQGYRWGQGPKKILFIHGWKSHAFRWKNYVDTLPKEEYTLYAFDAPGHGLSGGKHLSVPLYSDVIQEVIDMIGAVEVVVSHSIGSFSTMHALHQNPSLPIGRLVIMGAPGEALDFIHFYRHTLSLSDRAVRVTLAHFEKAIGKPIEYFSAARFAPELTLPGLIIHDKTDQEAPYAYAVQINKAWKNSRLLTTEGLTHNLRSPEVLAAVRDFIMDSDTLEVAQKRIKSTAESVSS